jgi:putative hemolysin
MLSSLNITSFACCLSLPMLIAVCVILIILSLLISGAEASFASPGQTNIKSFSNKKGLVPKSVSVLVNHNIELFATLKVAKYLVNISFIILISILNYYYTEFGLTSWWGIAAQLAIIATIILIFSEILPKILASKNSIFFIKLMAIPLRILRVLLIPVTIPLVKTIQFIEHRLQKKPLLSIDGLSGNFDLTSKALEGEKEILKGIIEFGNIEASEIMCPRVDVMTVETNEPFTQVLEKITRAQYSRIPVFSGTFDNIAGILYIKDLLPHFNKDDSFKWQTLVRAPYFVPETKKINDLLEELQLQKIHMAIVVDEYGGTSGIVTMEDIIETIVGDITDEFDDVEPNYSVLSDQVYLFKAKIPLAEFTEIMNLAPDYLDEVKGESESLAGLILEMKGELPKKGEVFTYKNLLFTIEEVDYRRIISVKVKVENTGQQAN